MEPEQSKIETEAAHFAKRDRVVARSSAFGSIPHIRSKINHGLNLLKKTLEHFGGRKPARALALGCGEMRGEYVFFCETGALKVDAYDIDAISRGRFMARHPEAAAMIEYNIGDVNRIELPENTYDLIYVQHAYHHFEALEHLTSQAWRALKPDGLFAISDYNGANFLQRMPNQRQVCARLWSILPDRLKVDRMGRLRKKLLIPNQAGLSPYEAIRSEELEGILRKHFRFREYFAYGGIVYPILNGFAHNYRPENAEDDAILALLWELDQSTLMAGTVEPNYFKAILTKQ
jgi:SAM-dependent methyltransferase